VSLVIEDTKGHRAVQIAMAVRRVPGGPRSHGRHDVSSHQRRPPSESA
jgi:hypothetical protein